MNERLLAPLKSYPGKVGFYYRNLVTGETHAFSPDLPFVAASVIKLPVMIEAFRQISEGILSPDLPITLRPEDRKPSCGVISYLHDNVTLTLMDMITVMIIVSDNAATNLLIDLLGMRAVNATLCDLGAVNSRLNRKLFEPELSLRGIQNHVTAGDMGLLLEKLYRGEVVSPKASEKMLSILSHQQLNGKIPFRLHSLGIRIAHKTGEDDGISHDVGIVYDQEPFVVCYLGNEVEVTGFERLMQDLTWRMLAPRQSV